MNYYNELDKKTAAWLRQLIADGHLPKGDVDERSITDVQPSDLDGYTQCHFFAGIGGWPYALALAGWPTTRPVWTGSCPCQPFSCAGKGKGVDDERHLWPEFARLISECRPATVFGEQVASKAGREWLSGVFADLEGMGYATAGADLCAASAGAPHIRQRLWWVADNNEIRRQQVEVRNTRSNRARDSQAGEGASTGVDGVDECGQSPEFDHFWSDYRIIYFRDRKARRIESSTEPLAHGIPARVVRLRGFGNAIVPQVAAEFIIAAEAAIKGVAQ